MSKFWLFLFIHLLQPKTVNAFQRVKLEDVKFADERFQDNSYWAKVLYCFCWSCIQVLRDFSMPQLTFFWPIYLLEWCRNWLWCEGSRDPWSSQRKVGTSCSLWFSFWEHLLENTFLSDSGFILSVLLQGLSAWEDQEEARNIQGRANRPTNPLDQVWQFGWRVIA